jgi:hypothetical protein
MGQAMKNICTAFCLACLGPAAAQSWFPDGATWQHHYFNVGAFLGYTRMVADGDTMLGGQQARVLRRETVTAFVTPPHGVQTTSRWPFAVTETEGLVSIWVDPQSAYDTLWNMNALPGDSWRLAPMTESIICDPESYAVVIDTGHTTISGVDLRWLAVDLHYLYQGIEEAIERDTIIERIGSTSHYFTPHDFCIGWVDGGDGLDLRCYTDAQISYNRTPLACESLLSISEVPAQAPTRLVHDGPGALRVLMQAETPFARLELYDATGRRLMDLRVRDGDPLRPGAAGMLVYRFTDPAGRSIGAGKVLVE